jgi:hypothetical protein
MAALQQQQQQRQQIVTWRRFQGRILSLDKGSPQIQSKPRSEWTPFSPVFCCSSCLQQVNGVI